MTQRHRFVGDLVRDIPLEGAKWAPVKFDTESLAQINRSGAAATSTRDCATADP